MFLDSPIAIWSSSTCWDWVKDPYISKTTNGHLIAHQSMDHLSFFSIRIRFGNILHFACLAKVSPSLCWSLSHSLSWWRRSSDTLLIPGTYNTSRLPYSFETETQHRGFLLISIENALFYFRILCSNYLSSSYSICRTLPVFPPHPLVSTFNIPNSSSRENVPDIT